MKATDSRVELDKTNPGPMPWSFLLTAGLVALIALAVGTTDYYLASVVIASISGLTGVFRIAFRGSRAFCLTLANLAGIYACILRSFSSIPVSSSKSSSRGWRGSSCRPSPFSPAIRCS
jgi:hypothetical protein